MLVAIEGLPGAGKTTSAAKLAERSGAGLVCETTHDHPFVASIYDDANRFDLQVELAFLLLHNDAYRAIDRQGVVFADFAPAKDLLFAGALLEGRDLEIFNALYGHLYSDHPPPELVLYLDASPELCLERVRQRLAVDAARQFEAALDLERLRLIRMVYEERLEVLGDQVIRLSVDAEVTPEQVTDRLVEIVESVHSPASRARP